MQRGDAFQAKQYLLALQANYHTQDDIQTMIAERLERIVQQEKNEEKEEEL